MPPLTDPQLVGFAARAEAVIDRVQSIVGPLDSVRRRRSPTATAWCVDQVLEHLCITNGFYIKRARRLVEESAANPRRGSGQWRPSPGGWLLAKSLDPRSTWKLPAPKVAKPGPEPREGVLEAFVQSMRDLEALMSRADGLELRHYRFRSPFASFIKLNLGDAFAVTVVHAQRHLAQIERTIAATA